MAWRSIYLASLILLEFCAADKAPGYWSSWTPCTVTCGKGMRFRSRPYVEGAHVKSKNSERLYEVKFCNRGSCLSKPTVSNKTDVPKILPKEVSWSSWHACSSSCGNGFSFRVKHCRSYRNCPNDILEMKTCVGQDLNCNAKLLELNEKEESQKKEKLEIERGEQKQLFFSLIFLISAASTLVVTAIVILIRKRPHRVSERLKGHI